jgi:hypothetical protein
MEGEGAFLKRPLSTPRKGKSPQLGSQAALWYGRVGGKHRLRVGCWPAGVAIDGSKTNQPPSSLKALNVAGPDSRNLQHFRCHRPDVCIINIYRYIRELSSLR